MPPAALAPATPTRASLLAYAALSSVAAIFFLAVLGFLGAVAVANERTYRAFRDEAAHVTGIITGFETFTTHGHRGGARLNTRPTVEFEVDGRRMRARLDVAHIFVPAQRDAWVGRSIELRYLPGRGVVDAGAVDQLPRATDTGMLILLILMTGVLICTVGVAVAMMGAARKAARR
jgi:flagellar basal body-associated protein FliL